MSAADWNPYAPPTSPTVERSSTAASPWVDGDAIELAGTLRSADVRNFLRCHDHIPLWVLLLVWLLAVVLPAAILWQAAAELPGVAEALIQSWPIAVGAGLAVTVCLAVSAIPYRQWVFQSLHPWWREPLRGTITAAGLTLDRGDGVTFHRWDWFGDAVKRGSMVGLIPTSLAAPPVILTPSTLADAAQWERVVAMARRVANGVAMKGLSDQQPPRDAIAILRDANRDRTVEVPAGAAPFAGAIYTADLMRMPAHSRRLQRPLRTHLVITLLFTSLAMMVIGLCQLMLPLSTWVPLLLGLGLLAMMTVVYYRKRSIHGRLVYYLMGFVTNEYVVTDFAVTTTHVSWADLQVVHRSDDFVALRRRRQSQFVLLRRDMFATADDWQTLTQAVGGDH